ncbi:hypothetical protein TNCV_3321421 [Trichonephila clavipes]|nr:hypothetical protein TNCV_3321421 [Trichonephila clavipes]
MTSLNILNFVVRLSASLFVYFQWIPSHIGLKGNKIADSLAKSVNADALQEDEMVAEEDERSYGSGHKKQIMLIIFVRY